MTERLEQGSLAIVGFGPSGLATALAASEQNQTVTAFDPASPARLGAGALTGYAINSNSAGRDFVEPILDHVAFDDLARIDGAEVLADSELSVPLPLVSTYLSSLASSAVELELVEHVRQKIAAIEPYGGAYLLHDTAGGLTLAERVIMATGAREELLDELATRRNDRTFVSSEVLGHQLPDELRESIEASDGQVVIVGGAHSAYSTANVILQEFDRAEIKVVKRKPTKPYFNSRDEAESEGHTLTEFDSICPQTGKVNRFVGIRGTARDIWRGEADNPQVTSVVSDELLHIDPEATVIQATGYRAVRPTLIGPDRRELEHQLGETIDGLGTFVVAGQVLPNLHAIGLGSGNDYDGFNTFWSQAQRHFQGTSQFAPSTN